MPLTIGTAGHIDHGKTWLVRALTGKDTDRLPEEQERGISIDLGYAPLDLPDGRRLSLIDVPGHERFVRTMVAGASGIDLFLLVIDAGEGARPQAHDEPIDVADAGQRVAVALPGIERHHLHRGDALVSPGAFALSYRLDVVIDELAPIPERALVHHGTAATLARVVRVGRFAQLRLAAPALAARGDRIVLRAGTTVGGGEVLDPAPPRHADAGRFERAERGERLVFAPVQDGGEWVFSDEWLDELRAVIERRLDAADPLEPGLPAPRAPWDDADRPRLR